MARTTFTMKKNAVRAANALIANGDAPSNEYTIEPHNGRFAIYWKPDETAFAAAEAEAPLADPSLCEEQFNPYPDGTLVIARGDGTAGWHPATVLSRCSTDGGAYWRVQFANRPEATLRQEPDIKIIEADRHAALIAEVEGKSQGAAVPKAKSVGRPRSREQTEAGVALANGDLPARPEITSPTNQHYVPRFKKLEALAVAGDWASVEAFDVKGKNTYAKMLIRYRDQLLTAHRIQQSQTAAAQ